MRVCGGKGVIVMQALCFQHIRQNTKVPFNSVYGSIEAGHPYSCINLASDKCYPRY